MQHWDKISWVLRTAADDLEELANDGRYTIDMDIYHNKYSDGMCHICMAGAVMAGTLECNIDDDMFPQHFTDEIRKALRALDVFRDGAIEDAFSKINGTESIYFCFEDKFGSYDANITFEGRLSPEETQHLINYAREWADKFEAKGY